MSKKIFSFVFIAVLAVTLSGCGKSLTQTAAEKYIETKTGVEIDQDGNTVKMKDGQGNTITATNDKAVPADWPSEAPYYQKATIDQAGTYEAGEVKNYSLSLSTKDSIEDITKYYREELKKNNWKINVDSAVSETLMLGAEKGNLSISVVVSGDGDEANEGIFNINQTVTVKK